MRRLGAETLRRLCKEPLADVKSLYLQGRAVDHLEGLECCPSLTALHISHNELTTLDEACFARCRELWILDASHNRIGSIEGLSSLLGIGYLNLSHNNLSLESLRPLARTTILELYLGDHSIQRADILNIVPGVWALDGEYVSEQEHRLRERCSLATKESPLVDVEHCYYGDGADGGIERTHSGGTREQDLFARREDEPGRGLDAAEDAPRLGRGEFSMYHPEYRDMRQQGRLTRKLLETVVWRIPYRSAAADPVRLRTLLERYDTRVRMTNKSVWLSTFTHGVVASAGPGEGEEGHCHRGRRTDPPAHLPQSHVETLLSLPANLKLDMAVLLAARASMREAVPQQMFAEALMVILLSARGIPAGVHTDLSRVPSFVYTALVYVLREAIVADMNKADERRRAPGVSGSEIPSPLNEAQQDLLEALPPIITGVEHALVPWKISSSSRENGAAATPEAQGLGESAMGAGRGNPRELQRARPGTLTLTARARSLYRRAIILLTRSPTCPSLVQHHVGTSDERLYNQMEPLLDMAGLSRRDLGPGPAASNSREGKRGETSTDFDGAGADGTVRNLIWSDPLSPWSDLDGDDSSREAIDDPEVTSQAFVESVATTSASRCNHQCRRPRVGEKIQVLSSTWSWIVSAGTNGEGSITVAPFKGMGHPPYAGDLSLDRRGLCYDPRGWWSHSLGTFGVGSNERSCQLHRPHRGLLRSGLPGGTGSLNVSLPRNVVHTVPPVAVGAQCVSEAQAAEETGRASGESLPISSAPSPCPTSPLRIFSAEASWDPAFVMASERLVGLQNKEAARKEGLERAKRLAWRDIDGPELYVASRSMISRCRTSRPCSPRGPRELLRPRPIPGLTVSWPVFRAKSEIISRATATAPPARRGFRAQLGSPRCFSAPLAPSAEGSTEESAWLDLQKEMGSLKADNQLRGDSGGETVGGKRSCRSPKKLKVRAGESPMSAFTETAREWTGKRIGTGGADWAERLCAELNHPLSARASNSRTPGQFGHRSTIFHLTQMGSSSGNGAATGQPQDVRRKLISPSRGARHPRVGSRSRHRDKRRDPGDETRRLSVCSSNGGLRQPQPSDGSHPKAGSVDPRWEPNVRDPAKWFPIPGRHVFRLDPSYVERCGGERETAAAVTIAAADISRGLPLGSMATAGEEITWYGDSNTSGWKTTSLTAHVPQEGLLGSRGMTFEGPPGSACQLSADDSSGRMMSPHIATQGANDSFTSQGPVEETPPVGDSRHRSDGNEELFSPRRAPGE